MRMSKNTVRNATRTALVATALGAVALGGSLPSQAAEAPTGKASTMAAAATSTLGGQISQAEILQRAQTWVDAGVPYNQGATYKDPQGKSYRTDCSGLVSMAWHLNAGIGATTWTLPNYSTKISSLDALEPGDALNNIDAHVVLFDKWTDSSKTEMWVYEHARPGTNARHIKYTKSYIAGQGMKGYRYNKVIDAPVTVPDKGMTDVTSVGDITGDGIGDVIAVDATTGELFRYSGPNFTGGTARVKIGTNWDTMGDIVGVGDQTGDGVGDIIATDAATGDLYRYSGPNYAGGTRVKIGSNWDSMHGIASVGDLTGDGKGDIIAVESATGDLYRYSGPNFTGGSAVKIGTGWNVYDTLVGTGDLTGDGKGDIVAVETATGDLYRYSGPSFNGGSRVKIGTNWNSMTNLTGPGDLNKDGVPDLLAVNSSTGFLFRYSGPNFTGGSAVQIGTKW
ncbi:VCBS repeat-containing protein [Streptomyces sp. ZAF1911]|uniref:C40 family peptidase n=1 Tax=unclassified Streptomyces TaxID=2593676 RepID=UPI00237B75D4|nr:VCBS repeat-containing protein [Streptomyces sp. ZAF1911]MDD9377689.1 VCBS repeat-containing protein [Streptomyces sp. ZAF1911]